jgi:mannose-6-phosphate isomerase
MSFMYNPFPFDDQTAVNRPVLEKKTIEGVTSGTLNSAKKLANDLAAKLAERPNSNIIVAFDGYVSADWSRVLNCLGQQFTAKGIEMEQVDFAGVYKSEEEIKAMIDPTLEWDKSKDPTLLFGRVFKCGYIPLFDTHKLESFIEKMEGLRSESGAGCIIFVYGFGSLAKELLDLYDVKCWFDVTPKECQLRIRRGQYKNIGYRTALPPNLIIRHCYYVEYNLAVGLRGDLLREHLLDYYLPSDDLDNTQLLSRQTAESIWNALSKYPFRCKPVYLEGIWGGTYMKKLRHLPDQMKNAAWVFDLIPMEVSVVVEVGANKVEFPFSTFFQKEGVSVMGEASVNKFGYYFPVRFNYDDSYHSTGNMSIQCHSGGKFNIENFDEFGRQDESYYVVVAGHHAKTFLGFRNDADIPQFYKDIEAADTEHKEVDYMKYVSYEDSKPGLQVMIPAGTIHSSGRNQVVLEIGSLTIGSYTYKLYDYLRLDFDGKQRPIHTKMGEQNLVTTRRTDWVRQNIVQQPREVRSGKGWAEYVVGEHDLLYFTLRRLEFETSIPENTNGQFHVLSLVDGEHIRIRSVANPERYYDANYMDIVVVPADMGEYVIENLGKEPICVHKTMLKDGFETMPK